MTNLKIDGITPAPASVRNDLNGKEADKGFDSILKDAVTKVAQVQNDAEKAIKDLASGGDVSHAVIAMEKADMSFQAMVEIRNRLLNAYDEIMRMQV